MKKGEDHSVVVEFYNLRPADRAKFNQDNHDKLGPQLKMAIKQLVTMSGHTQTLMAKGHMIDEFDLRVKYEDKPDQLAAIMQNAYSFECPIRRCLLYADPEFCTVWSFRADITDQSLNLETDDTAIGRATKRIKAEKAPPVPGDEKALTFTDLSKLKALFDICGADVNMCVASIDLASHFVYTEYIAAKVISKMNEKKTELVEKKSEMRQILDSGKSRYSPKDLRKMICELRKQAKDEHDDVESRLATARSDIAATNLY